MSYTYFGKASFIPKTGLFITLLLLSAAKIHFMHKRIRTHYKNAEFFATIMDSQFKIGKYSFGLDPILGLFPGGGDFVAFILSLYIVWIGLQMRIPAHKVALMIGNVVYDFILGVIPIIGDVLDFTFKANSRNMQILREFVPEEIYEGVVV